MKTRTMRTALTAVAFGLSLVLDVPYALALCDQLNSTQADSEVFFPIFTARADAGGTAKCAPLPMAPPPPAFGRNLPRQPIMPAPIAPGKVECPQGSTFPSYRAWHRWAHEIHGGAARGDTPFPQGNLEFDKHVNAGFVMNTGLADDNDFSFHAAVDYRWVSWKLNTIFRDAVEHFFSDDLSVFGRFSEPFFGTNEITTTCLLYSPSHIDSKTEMVVLHPNAQPASRGGDFVHEGWHGWQARRGYRGHEPNPPGGMCTLKGKNCDFFYFHGVSEYVFGALWETDRTEKRFHSPNQVQVEYLCDLVGRPAPWVPVSVTQAARMDANLRAMTRFINGPGYFCGTPRPF
jgi:hypothetical protein